jgi:hypothetical protein
MAAGIQASAARIAKPCDREERRVAGEGRQAVYGNLQPHRISTVNPQLQGYLKSRHNFEKLAVRVCIKH